MSWNITDLVTGGNFEVFKMVVMIFVISFQFIQVCTVQMYRIDVKHICTFTVVQMYGTVQFI